MRRSTRFAFRFVPILVGLGLTMGSGAKAQEWTRFRGPNGTGVSDAKSIPTTFSEADYNWRIELPGYGHSQPVIWGQKIFVTSAPEDGSARHVSCVSVENGKILWTKSFEATSYHNHERSSYASSTPALDESRVYVTFQTGNRAFLAALDHDGELVWTHDLGTYDSQHGYGASPIVYKDLLVFPFEQIAREGKPSPSYVIALDRATGDLVWKTMRRSRRAAY
ncbi:MAG TPA: PQQ-binding-like beta-propeller repeat protein, partial [Planctomycetota bacterium]|nr:PQQ-binding-like beta-propeller repeat protein [Planctomycetota bacterium]